MTSTAALFAWLLRHVEHLRWDESAGQAWDELRYCARTVARAVDNHPARRYAGRCDAPTANGHCPRPLYTHPDHDVLRCDGYGSSSPYDVGCRAQHTPDDRDAWLLRQLDYALLPLEYWRECLPAMLTDLTWPNRSTYWRWIEHGRLTVKTTVGGVEHFRGGDIVELVTREQPRIRGNIAGYARRTAQATHP